MRDHLPEYTGRTAVLNDLLNRGLASAPRRNKKAAQKLVLTELGWDSACDRAWEDCRLMLQEAVTLAHPDPTLEVCVFSDASHTHWGAVITQVPAEQMQLPLREQVHQPLIFLSGAFRGSSLKWPIIDKEAYALIHTVRKCDYLLIRERGCHLFTDHRNLIYLFNPAGEGRSMGRPQAERVQRWGWILMGLNYVIHHVPGEDNIWADMLSRWMSRHQSVLSSAVYPVTHQGEDGVPSAVEEVSVVPAVSAQGGQGGGTAQAKLMQSTAAPATEATTEAPAVTAVAANVRTVGRRPKALRKGVTFEESIEPEAPQVRRRKTLVDASKNQRTDEFKPGRVFSLRYPELEFPTLKEIAGAQFVAVREAEGVVDKELLWKDVPDGDTTLPVWYKKNEERVWIPDKGHLRLRLCVAAHCGAAGHRGMMATYLSLKRRFYWKGMQKDVNDFCLQCLHCVTTRGGNRVPRPMGSACHATDSNCVLHWDYLFIRKALGDSRHGCSYILCMMDDFDGYVELHAAAAPTALNCVNGLLEWFKRTGIVEVWISDQGSHFKNEVLEELGRRLGSRQQFVVAYAPWANGTIERLNVLILSLLRALISEWKLEEDDWYYLLPVVMMAINNSVSVRLGNKTHMEVRTGRAVKHPLDVIVVPTLEKVTTIQVDTARVIEQCAEVRKALDEMHQEVAALKRDPHVAEGKHAVRVNWAVGDYVLLARVSKGAQNKLVAKWRGPMRVVATVNDWVYRVQDLITKDEHVVHAERLRYYSDAALQITTPLKEIIAHDNASYSVGSIEDHREFDGEWQLWVSWLGFEEVEDSWEPLQSLAQDDPASVRKYLKSLEHEDEADVAAMWAVFNANK